MNSGICLRRTVFFFAALQVFLHALVGRGYLGLLRTFPIRDVFDHRQTVEWNTIVVPHEHRGDVEPGNVPVRSGNL